MTNDEIERAKPIDREWLDENKLWITSANGLELQVWTNGPRPGYSFSLSGEESQSSAILPLRDRGQLIDLIKAVKGGE